MKSVNSVSDIWDSVLAAISKDLPSVAITTWFSDCSAVDINGNTLVLHTSTPFKKRIIETRFSSMIKNTLSEIFAADFDILLLCGDELEKYVAQKKKTISGEYGYEEEEYTFDTFVVGSSNKYAHAAAVAVSNGANKDYNPLFIFGESGLGKTHLLFAIRHEVKAKHPEYNIVYVKGEEFVNDAISSIQTGKMTAFREKYRNADLFLMDDVQFIAGKVSTQEEMFHAFNNLYEEGHQIVFTADRPPKEILRLDDRLRTRFESGLMACVEKPDYETRMAIIKNKALQLGLILSDEVMDYIANTLTSDVRQLEGVVNNIKAHKELMNEEVDTALVSKIIEGIITPQGRITPEIIIEETAKYYSVLPEDIKGRSKVKVIVNARQVCMYLIRTLTSLTLSEIGGVLERDHATVIHSLNQIESKLKTDGELKLIIKDITSNINTKK